MSQAAPTPDPDRPDRLGQHSTEAGRRRGKVLIPGVILAVMLGIVAVLLLITRCGSSVDDVSQGNDSRSTAVTAVVEAGSGR